MNAEKIELIRYNIVVSDFTMVFRHVRMVIY